MAKFYYTRYALSAGIMEVEGELVADSEGKLLRFKRRDSEWADYAHAPDFYVTMDEAQARAKVMQEKKLISLEKTRKKVAALTFDTSYPA